jgi:hypothetical protein
MARRFWVLAFILYCAAITLPASGAKAPLKKLLPEGFSLRGVDGKLQPSEGNGEWFFEFDADVNEAKAGIAGATRLNILPCGMLEAMVADSNERSMNQFRLWAAVTQYRGFNYIFPAYYLPLGKTDMERTVIEYRIQKSEIRRGGTEDSKTMNHKSPIIDNRGQPRTQTDEVGIPTEIIMMLQQDKDKSRRSAAAEQKTGDKRRETEDREQKNYELRTPNYIQNRILVDVVGFLRKDGTGFLFMPDAVGRNIARDYFRLLPCRTLEQLEREQSTAADPVRFAVAGLITQYKGDRYLLLQRAIRVYSHGNFTN